MERNVNIHHCPGEGGDDRYRESLRDIGDWLVSILLAILLFLFSVFALLALIASAYAHDQSDPDVEWYRSLEVPGTGGGFSAPWSCCSGETDGDCKNVEMRQVRDPDGSIHLEAFADRKLFPDSDHSPFYGHAPNAWVRIPDAAIIHGKNNPTGRAVGCWFNRKWRCVVEGTGT